MMMHGLTNIKLVGNISKNENILGKNRLLNYFSFIKRPVFVLARCARDWTLHFNTCTL